jgi:uncharacterized iron-regulated membrane protein
VEVTFYTGEPGHTQGTESFDFDMSAQSNAREMTAWQRWVQRPQRLWFRRALFQVHLWVGIGIGIYVLTISISGSALVHRRELTKIFSRKVVVSTESGRRMSVEELAEQAQRAYQTYELDTVREAETPDGPDYVVLERAHTRIERLLDPYTGADLGNAHSAVERILIWLTDLHDNLLGGRTGRYVNGIGSCLVTLIALTGAILWWPGIKNWRRSTTISWKSHFPRLNWDVHSAIGFWCWLFVMVWGISGIYFCFPVPFGPGVHLFAGLLLSWITQLHFGRFNGLTMSLWTLLGLVPGISAVTGVLMWWNRVLRKRFRRPQRQGHAGGAISITSVDIARAGAKSGRSRACGRR